METACQKLSQGTSDSRAGGETEKRAGDSGRRGDKHRKTGSPIPVETLRTLGPAGLRAGRREDGRWHLLPLGGPAGITSCTRARGLAFLGNVSNESPHVLEKQTCSP